ncbi:hypothetical protein LCGC14_1281640 [marine sediment metagenome]|uniref:Acb2/Tad1 hairpin domain-containing protein n=1 Tax=marine sediment metagenome TaxID=412755 RepID=A0A0F9LG41_9ZZZZ
MILDDDQLLTMFVYQQPDNAKIARHAEISAAASAFAVALMTWAPDGLDRDKALECIREARMWANSAIALDGKIGWPLYNTPESGPAGLPTRSGEGL